MTKRTFPNPLLAALFLVALLTATAFAQDETITVNHNYTGYTGDPLTIDLEDDNGKLVITAIGKSTLNALKQGSSECFEVAGLDKSASTAPANATVKAPEFSGTFVDEEEWNVIWEKVGCFNITAKHNYTGYSGDPLTIDLEEDDNGKLVITATGKSTLNALKQGSSECFDVAGLDKTANVEPANAAAKAPEFDGTFEDKEEWHVIWKKKETCSSISITWDNDPSHKLDVPISGTASNNLKITESLATLKGRLIKAAFPDENEACYALTELKTGTNPNEVDLLATDKFTTTVFTDGGTATAKVEKSDCFTIIIVQSDGATKTTYSLDKTTGRVAAGTVAALIAKENADNPAAACFDIEKLTHNTASDVAKGDIETTDFKSTDGQEWKVKEKKEEKDGCRFVIAHENNGTGKSPKIPLAANGTIATGSSLPTGLKNACFVQDGWNTSAKGDGSEKTNASTFTDGEEIYAKWDGVGGCKRITFLGNGGKINGQDELVLEATTVTGGGYTVKTGWPANTALKRDGFTFNDWKFENSNKVATSSTVFADEATLEADWARIPTTPVIAPAIASSFSIVVNSQNLQILGASKAMPVSIYNLKGKLVLNSTAMPNESISVAHLPKGVYIVRAGSKTAKFAK